jgi:uncharacterized protein YxjI
MRISRGGQPVAWVRKLVSPPLREHYLVDLGLAELSLRGRPLDYEYTLGYGRRTIVAVTRAWVSAPERYGVEVAPSQDDILLLAVTVCITLMSGAGARHAPAPPGAPDPAAAGPGPRSEGCSP